MIYPSTRSFFDPLETEDGKPYAKERYKQIVREQYLISRTINTSFVDLDKVTPLERSLLLRNIVEDNERAAEKSNQNKGK